MIAPLALRLSACRALIGNTFAETRVYDSAVAAIEELIGEDPKPFIVVSTDDQTYNLTGMDVTGGASRAVDIVIDIGVGSAVVLDGGDMAVMVPHTDAGTEMSVNLITRQALRVLFEPNSGGAWGKTFRAIGQQATRIIIRRGAGAEKGVKFAAAQLIISMAPLAEPAFGVVPSFVWGDFVAQTQADASLSHLAPMILAIIVGDVIPEWREAASLLGLNDETAEDIGILPLGRDNSQPVSQSTVNPDGWIDDAVTVGVNLPEIEDGK